MHDATLIVFVLVAAIEHSAGRVKGFREVLAIPLFIIIPQIPCPSPYYIYYPQILCSIRLLRLLIIYISTPSHRLATTRTLHVVPRLFEHGY